MTIETDLQAVISATTTLNSTVQSLTDSMWTSVNNAIASNNTATTSAINTMNTNFANLSASAAPGVPGWYKYAIDLSALRPDYFYPVRFISPGDAAYQPEKAANTIHEINISRTYYMTPQPAADNPYVPYNGSHWLGMHARIVTSGGAWDGGPSWADLQYNMATYRQGIGAVRQFNMNYPYTYVWIRGGCLYFVQQSFSGQPTVLCGDLAPLEVEYFDRNYYSGGSAPYQEQIFVNAISESNLNSARSLYYNYITANGTDTRTAGLYQYEAVTYGSGKHMGTRVNSWAAANYQDALASLEQSALASPVWGSESHRTSTALPVINDQQYLAFSFMRYTQTTMFPNRISGKNNVTEKFTPDEFEITCNLSNYVAP